MAQVTTANEEIQLNLANRFRSFLGDLPALLTKHPAQVLNLTDQTECAAVGCLAIYAGSAEGHLEAVASCLGVIRET